MVVGTVSNLFASFQVDVAQGAEEMVEKLTEKTLLQEEKLEKLEEEKADLVGFWMDLNWIKNI